MAGIAADPAVTPAPRYPLYGRFADLEELERRQLTFTSCGLSCADSDLCQGYRSNFGFCCPKTVLSRSVNNFCNPATACADYTSGVSNVAFDSTSSIQYCFAARPSCVTYIYTSDSYTQIFCASDQSGTYFFATTSSSAESAVFVGSTSSIATSTRPTPSATVINAPTTASNTSSATNANSTAGTGTDPLQTTSPNSSGLSKGAIAGIAVGVALLTAAVLLLAFWMWRRRNKNKNKNTAPAGFSTQPPMLSAPYVNPQYAQPQGGQPGGGWVDPSQQQYGYQNSYPPPVSQAQEEQRPFMPQANSQDYYKQQYPGYGQSPQQLPGQGLMELPAGQVHPTSPVNGGYQQPQSQSQPYHSGYHETMSPNEGRQELQS